MFDTFTLIHETMENLITELKPDYNIHRRSVIMSIVVNSIPLVPYLIFMAGLFFGFIYSIYDVKKNSRSPDDLDLSIWNATVLILFFEQICVGSNR